jgi:predicted nucleotidyltransferase
MRADSSITAVMLMGSVATGTETEGSDLDLFILGNKNKFSTDIVDDILVEYLYCTFETAQMKLEKIDMEVYHYLGSKIIYDLDGRLLKLIRAAMNKYQSHKASERELSELSHWLYSTKLKLTAAINTNNIMKSDFLTATSSWKLIEAVFAINNIPLPPAGRVLQELSKLNKTPEQDWFLKLFGKDTTLRTETMINIIDWGLPLL